MNTIELLLRQSGAELCAARSFEAVPMELRKLLAARNGFFAFGASLLVRPSQTVGPVLGIAEWNAGQLWKAGYPGDILDVVFFAEDLFGGQFGWLKNHVVSMDAETGDVLEIAASIEEWCSTVLAEPDVLTGHPLEREWTSAHGEIAAGTRLVAKKPFVLGGDYSVQNLYACRDVEAMQARASLASQLCGVPDGEQVVVRRGPSGDG